MAALLGIIGFAISAYGVWTGLRIAKSTGVFDRTENLLANLDLIVLQLSVPGSIFVLGLLLMGAASALASLVEIKRHSEKTAELLTQLYLKIPPRP